MLDTFEESDTPDFPPPLIRPRQVQVPLPKSSSPAQRRQSHMVSDNERRELTLLQKAALKMEGKERRKLARVPTDEEYAAAKTVCFKVWHSDDSAMQRIMKAIRKASANAGSDAREFDFLVWNSDVRDATTGPRFLQPRFRLPFNPHNAGDVLVEAGLNYIEMAWYSPREPQSLCNKLGTLPEDERYVPDAAELQRRADERERDRRLENYKRRCRDLAHDAEQLEQAYQEACRGFQGVAALSEFVPVVRSFERDVVKLARRVDIESGRKLQQALVAASSLPEPALLPLLHFGFYGMFVSCQSAWSEAAQRQGGDMSGARRSIYAFIKNALKTTEIGDYFEAISAIEEEERLAREAEERARRERLDALEAERNRLEAIAAAKRALTPPPPPKPERSFAYSTWSDLDGRKFPMGFVPPWAGTIRGQCGAADALQAGRLTRDDLPWVSDPSSYQSYQPTQRVIEILSEAEDWELPPTIPCWLLYVNGQPTHWPSQNGLVRDSKGDMWWEHDLAKMEPPRRLIIR